MNDNEARYAAVRARNLAHELMMREETGLSESDIALLADALVSYGEALFSKRTGKDLGDMERTIIGRYAGEFAGDIRGAERCILGPPDNADSELFSRALKFYSRELMASLRTFTAIAA